MQCASCPSGRWSPCRATQLSFAFSSWPGGWVLCCCACGVSFCCHVGLHLPDGLECLLHECNHVHVHRSCGHNGTWMKWMMRQGLLVPAWPWVPDIGVPEHPAWGICLPCNPWRDALPSRNSGISAHAQRTIARSWNAGIGTVGQTCNP